MRSILLLTLLHNYSTDPYSSILTPLHYELSNNYHINNITWNFRRLQHFQLPGGDYSHFPTLRVGTSQSECLINYSKIRKHDCHVRINALSDYCTIQIWGRRLSHGSRSTVSGIFKNSKGGRALCVCSI